MITNVLILLSTVLSLYAWTTPENLAFSENALFHGGYYTLITGIFVHANPVHLAGNMIFLRSVSAEPELCSLQAVYFLFS